MCLCAHSYFCVCPYMCTKRIEISVCICVFVCTYELISVHSRVCGHVYVFTCISVKICESDCVFKRHHLRMCIDLHLTFYCSFIGSYALRKHPFFLSIRNSPPITFSTPFLSFYFFRITLGFTNTSSAYVFFFFSPVFLFVRLV